MEMPQPRPNGLAPDQASGLGSQARPVQWAVAFLLGVGVALLGGRIFRSAQPRPTERERVVIVTAVDLNQASKTELLQLPGVGESLADTILATRDQLGGFRTVDDLRRVKGIGPARFESLRPYLRVDLTSVPISVPIHIAFKPPPGSPIKPSTGPIAGKKAPPAGPIDVNRASLEELQQLPGVGPVLSHRIVATREKMPFKSVDDLRRVSGIGVKTLEKLRPLVTVSASPDDTPAACP